MSFLTSTLATIIISIIAILFTLLASWLSFNSILIGVGITRPILVLWIISGVLWSIIGFKALWNYIMSDKMAQGLILTIIVLYILFAPPKQKNSKKQIKLQKRHNLNKYGFK